MKKEKIPTILGLIILTLGILVGTFLIRNKQFFRLGASPTLSPKNVRFSNITDSSFTVSWTTDKETAGFVKLGTNQSNLNRVESDSINVNSFTHSVSIRSLNPQTQYFLKINSGGIDFDNSGTPWQVKTGLSLLEPKVSIIASGTILTEVGTPAMNALVYANVGGGELLSTYTSQNGSWLIPISSARNKTLDLYIDIDPKLTLVEFEINSGPLGISSAQIYPQSANPVPNMILGQVYDFKSLPPSQEGNIPSANLEIPTEKTSQTQSGFSVDGNLATPSAKTVTLESIDEGEIVATTDPEFFGKGPSGTDIVITMESETITENITISKNGSWKWSPTQDLDQGIHKITITWKDTNGVLRKLTRNFIVQASETPAFVSTPSGTPKLTSTPIPTKTASESAAPAQPVSGSLTPTLILSIMGIGTIIFGFLIWKKSEI